MTTQAPAKLRRWNLKCEACNSFKVVDSASYPSTQCPCGQRAKLTQVQGTFSEKHVCDPRCTSAIGPVCVCGCGGANHQIAWLGLPTWHLTFNGKVVESTPERRAAIKAEKAAKKAARRPVYPASTAQRRYIDDLLRQKDVPAEADAIDTDVLNSTEARVLLDWLTQLPYKQRTPVVTLTATAAPQQNTTPAVPDGRYAITTEGETQARFYRVNSPKDGKWKGYTFVSEVKGGQTSWGNERSIRDRAERNAVLHAIARDTQKAMADYGFQTGRCGKCHALLTDEVSVANGIGPVCIKTLGWTPRA